MKRFLIKKSFVELTPMKIYFPCGLMGKGKTLFAVNCAKSFIENNKSNIVYANFKINMERCVFSPFMFFRLADLENCLIIIDDIYALPNLVNVIQVIVNMSRKKNIFVIITGQYYAMLSKMLRSLLCNVKLQLNDDKSKMYCILYFYDDNNKIIKFEYIINHPIENVQNLYNTNEVVKIPLEEDIIREICRFSNDDKDIKTNISLYTKDKRKQKAMYKDIKGMKDSTFELLSFGK